MKKIYIIMAVLATAVMVSCEREKSFNDEKIGENTLVISMQGAPSTRSMETGAVIETGKTIELGKDAEGTAFVLEETIQDLNAAWAPATKGTPVYTENVGVLYEKMGVYAGGSSNYDFYSMDNSEGSATGSMTGGGWRYAGEFNWAQDAYDFYFWMPKTDNGITGGTPTCNNLSFTFSYTSPTTAAAQKDLIFAARNITKTEAQGDYRINGVPVLFNHALTGVKFAIGNDLEKESVSINSVTFVGLKNTATDIVMTPVGALVDDKKREYRDSITNYTSAGTIDWSSATADPVKNTISSGDYTTTTTYSSGAGSFGNNKGNYPASFSVAGNKNNLGDSDGSQVFWLIPQSFTADSQVQLVINYTYADVTDTWTIDFGKALAGVTWKAGELRTYTIKVDDVDVTITDTVNATKKEAVTITNDSNVDVFIRAAIVGQWVDEHNNPVFSFTDFKDGSLIIKPIASWYQDQFGTNAQKKFGTFENLPGTGWVKGTDDDFYYYTSAVAPGATTGTPLFKSYTVNTANIPNITVGGIPQKVHFVLSISTQAISAKEPSVGKNYESYTDAWAAAETVAQAAQ